MEGALVQGALLKPSVWRVRGNAPCTKKDTTVDTDRRTHTRTQSLTSDTTHSAPHKHVSHERLHLCV